MTKDILIYAFGFAALSGWASAAVIAWLAGGKAADLEAAIGRWKLELVKCFRSPRRVEKLKKVWASIPDGAVLSADAREEGGFTQEVIYALEELMAKPNKRQRAPEPSWVTPARVQELRQKARIEQLKAMGVNTSVPQASDPPTTITGPSGSVAVVAACRSDDCDREVKQ